MSSIMVINPHGHHVPVTREVWNNIVARGEGHLYQRSVIRHRGTGSPKRICILLHKNGIGDDVHSLPAIGQKIKDGYEVHVAGFDDPEWLRLNMAPMFERVGAKILPGIGQGDLSSLKSEFGMIYSMAQWCLEHDWDTAGEPTMGYMEQFAKFIDTKLPDTFDFKRCLYPNAPKPERKEIVIALTASSLRKSYPNQMTLASMFSDPVRVIGGVRKDGQLPWEELIKTIYHAKLVIGAYSGPSVIALALGAPLLGVFGPSNSDELIPQFARYSNIRNVYVARSKGKHPCKMPCSEQEARGWGVNGKCQSNDYADCMMDITPEQIAWDARILLNQLDKST